MRKQGIHGLYQLQHAFTPLPDGDPASILDPLPLAEGNADSGYKYITRGNGFSSGIPVEVYRMLDHFKKSKLSGMAGFSRFTMNDFVIFNNGRGREVATPGCLHCHAQQFNNKMIEGLGNSYSSFQVNTGLYLTLIEKGIRLAYGKNSDEWKTAERTFLAAQVLPRSIITEVQGPAPAQKIAEVMASHRDPLTLQFRADTSYFNLAPVVMPEDVPALWIAAKRKALTVNAMRQGDFLKHIVTTSLLTLKDSGEAREIYEHARDIWAWIKTIQPPKYPYAINEERAGKGKVIFLQACARCHGTYGDKTYYPNVIVPPHVIGTDSMLWKYFIKYTGYTEWFNKSWLAVSNPVAQERPQPGYVPPPLDGVWITAPYLHNGSVPTIENVLNSKSRPVLWKRNFNKEEYDYEKLGWRYKVLSRPHGKKTYDTRIPGYGNYGHTFGDHLSESERKNVIEYLKTL